MKPTRSSYAGLLAGVDACIELAEDPARMAAKRPEVSDWGVAEHVEHLLLADRGIVGWMHGVLEAPEPEHREGEPTEIGRRVLASASISRGRGPAPEGTLPEGMDRADLAAALRELRARCEPLEDRLDEIATSRHTLPHHVLGHFSPADWLRFLTIHHRHHAAIIRDILG